MSAVLALLNSVAAEQLILFAFRVGGVVLIAPVFSSRTVPMMVRTALVVLIVWLLAPVVVQGSARVAITPATALAETLVGFAIGLAAAVFVGAAEAMGDLLSVSIGLSGAAALDPLTNQSVPVLGQFANLFAVASLLAVNAHHLMLEALAASVHLVPMGGVVNLTAGVAEMVKLGSMLFVLGLRFAAPVIAVVLLANVALAILARVAPQLNVLSVAFPFQIGLGLLGFAAAVPLIGTFFSGWRSFYEGIVMHILGALMSAGAR